MAATEQEERPLASAFDRINGDEEGRKLSSSKKLRKRPFIICCGCCAATVVILALVIVVLAVTVFQFKDPVITMNSVKIDRMSIGPGGGLLFPSRPAINMTLTVDVSVKNPNAGSFKFSNATTSISYRGNTIGEVQTPPGKASARRTLRMNATVDVLADRLVGDNNLIADLASGVLPVSTYTEIGGRVNLLNLFKRHVDVVMTCTLTVSVANQAIQDQNCKPSIKL